jgi:hypothetical protein
MYILLRIWYVSSVFNDEMPGEIAIACHQLLPTTRAIGYNA